MKTIHSSRAPLWWHLACNIATFFSPLRAGMLTFVALPTLIAGIYYSILAADIYVSESAFSARLEQGLKGGDASGIMQSLMPTSGQHDQLAVNSFMLSRGALDALLKTMDLRAIYRASQADFWAALKDHATDEELLAYYQSRIKIIYDERSQISSITVEAFSAEEAHAINEALLKQAETFVNHLSDKMRQDSIAFAKSQLADAEEAMVLASNAVSAYRRTHQNFDPTSASKAKVGMMHGLETELAKRKAELQAASGVLTGRNQQLVQMQREVAALSHQLEQQRAQLLSNAPDSLGQQFEEYGRLVLKQEFSAKRYELALAAVEAAHAEAAHKSIYLVRIVEPSLPDEAVEPRRLRAVLTVFFLSLTLYGMVLLIVASIGDHIRR